MEGGGRAWKQSWKEVVSFPDPQAKKGERVWEIALLVRIALAAEFMECNFISALTLVGFLYMLLIMPVKYVCIHNEMM